MLHAYKGRPISRVRRRGGGGGRGAGLLSLLFRSLSGGNYGRSLIKPRDDLIFLAWWVYKNFIARDAPLTRFLRGRSAKKLVTIMSCFEHFQRQYQWQGKWRYGWQLQSQGWWRNWKLVTFSRHTANEPNNVWVRIPSKKFSKLDLSHQSFFTLFPRKSYNLKNVQGNINNG